MTPREIQIEIAKQLGWKVTRLANGEWCLFDPDGIAVSWFPTSYNNDPWVGFAHAGAIPDFIARLKAGMALTNWGKSRHIFPAQGPK